MFQSFQKHSNFRIPGSQFLSDIQTFLAGNQLYFQVFKFLFFVPSSTRQVWRFKFVMFFKVFQNVGSSYTCFLRFFKVFNVFHIFQNLGSSFSKMLVSRVDFKRCKNHKMLVSRVFHVFHIFQAFTKCWFQVLISKGVKFTKCWFQVFHGFSKMLVSSVDFERCKLHKCWFQGFIHQNVEFTKCVIF